MVWKKKSELLLLIALLFCNIYFTSLHAQNEEEVAEEEIVDEEISMEDLQEIIEQNQSGYYDDEGNWHSLNSEEENLVDPNTVDQAEPVAVPQRDVWTTEQWKKSISDLDYTKPEEREKREQRERERNQTQEQVQPNDSWSFNWPVIPTQFWQIVVFSLIIITLVYLIWQLLTKGNWRKDKKLKGDIGFSLEHIEDNLEESDLDRYLRHALDAGDYKSAVRIFYLAIIKTLHENRLIRWKKEKTNFDFVVEMRPSNHYQSFRDVTRAFELVWYGDISVSEKQFNTMDGVFRKFLNELSNGTKK
ncbi:MAG: DUF4129 domain-containing protein [Flavobacteriales bacterium]|nr:DUF4129 domain-containing protein [Flavobacteriales bacterium]